MARKSQLGVAIVSSMRVIVLACAIIGSACASSTSTTDNDASVTPPRTPVVHRAVATDCPTTRDAGMPQPIGQGPCKVDGDCTQGTNGRCNFALGSGGNTCSYDQCTTDTKCGAGVCLCRDPSSAGANVCVNGNCRLDAQCAPFACSPSGVNIDVGCRSGISSGQMGYFCHAPGDECVDNADCKASPNAPEQSCIFSVSKLHWVCVPTPCAG